MTSQFPAPLVQIISDYAAVYTVVPWLTDIEDKLIIYPNWDNKKRRSNKQYELSKNPMAMDMADEFKYTIDGLYYNSSDWALDILERDIYQYELIYNHNPRAIKLITKTFNKLSQNNWVGLLMNPNAIEIINDNLAHIKYASPIYANTNEAVLEIIKKLPITINPYERVYYLATNSAPWAIELLKSEEITRGIITALCNNSHPWAIEQVSQHLHKLDISEWNVLSKNSGAIHILRANPDKITTSIWSNPAIFELTPRPEIFAILTEILW